jgi:hypothetical protein
MTSKQLGERLTYVAMSVFVAWHTLAIVVPPGPDNSVVVQSLRGLLHPYITLFRLDHKWDFYAPNVGRGHQFRYVVEDAAGTRHAFVPTDELSWHHPHYWWFRAWYGSIIGSPDDYGETVAAALCRKHASLKPTTIDLLKLEELEFSPADHLRGKHPLDSEFVVVSTVKQVKCPGS